MEDQAYQYAEIVHQVIIVPQANLSLCFASLDTMHHLTHLHVLNVPLDHSVLHLAEPQKCVPPVPINLIVAQLIVMNVLLDITVTQQLTLHLFNVQLESIIQ